MVERTIVKIFSEKNPTVNQHSSTIKICPIIHFYLYLSLIAGILVFVSCATFYSIYYFESKALRQKNQELGNNTSIGLSKAQLDNLGYTDFNPKKLSNFTNFPTKKPLGVIRIALLGGKNFVSPKAIDKFDVAYYLQEIFTEKGIKNVEVINFSNDGFDLSQAYLFWQYLVKNYEIDFLILDPDLFRYHRYDQNSFQIQLSGKKIGFRSKFIIENNQLKLIPSPGKNFQEKLNIAYSLFPNKTYLKYDRLAPNFIRSLVSERFRFMNPFYYSKLWPDQEQIQINELILNDLKGSIKNIVLLHPNKKIVNIATSIGANFFQINNFFPNLAEKNFSNIANYQLAQQYFHILSGQQNFPQQKVTFQKINIENQANYQQIDLYWINQLYFSFDENLKFASFYPSNQAQKQKNIIEYIQKHKIKSLLGIKSPNMAITDSIFIPLDFPITPQDKLLFQNNKRESKLLSSLHFFHHNLPIAIAEIPDLEIQFNKNSTSSYLNLATFLGKSHTYAHRYAIKIGKHNIHEGIFTESPVVMHTKHSQWKMIAKTNYPIRKELKDRPLFLDIQRKNNYLRIPFVQAMEKEAQVEFSRKFQHQKLNFRYSSAFIE